MLKVGNSSYRLIVTTRCRAVRVTDKFRENRFDGVDDDEDRPLIAQFCGNCPETVVSRVRGRRVMGLQQ